MAEHILSLSYGKDSLACLGALEHAGGGAELEMVLTDEKRALLGDHEAAKRLTEAGVLVPCWRCGGEAELQEIHTGGKPVYAVSCKKHHCGAYGCAHQTKKNAVAYWNTRAPILSAEEMEMLYGKENP